MSSSLLRTASTRVVARAAAPSRQFSSVPAHYKAKNASWLGYGGHVSEDTQHVIYN